MLMLVYVIVSLVVLPAVRQQVQACLLLRPRLLPPRLFPQLQAIGPP
jgi:hypothetical protein